jgi:hypothetical protein
LHCLTDEWSPAPTASIAGTNAAMMVAKAATSAARVPPPSGGGFWLLDRGCAGPRLARVNHYDTPIAGKTMLWRNGTDTQSCVVPSTRHNVDDRNGHGCPSFEAACSRRSISRRQSESATSLPDLSPTAPNRDGSGGTANATKCFKATAPPGFQGWTGPRTDRPVPNQGVAFGRKIG